MTTPSSNIDEIVIDSSSDHENNTESDDCPSNDFAPKINQHELNA